MGMVAILRRIDDASLRQLLAYPEAVLPYLDEEGEDPITLVPPAPLATGFLARLFGRKSPPLPPVTLTLDRSISESIDLDKAWHAIHFMLTGAVDETPHPLGFICGGGTFVGTEDVGIGPARGYSAAETRVIVDALAPITAEEFLSRFHAPALLKAKIYPEQIWAPDRADEHNEFYVRDNFVSLRNFLIETAGQGHGFLIYLS